MNQIKSFAPAISVLQEKQKVTTRRLFAMGLALVGAALLAFPAAGQEQTMAFEVEGTWVGTGRQEANLWGGTFSGQSSLGPFTGTFVEHGGDKRVGSGTLDFPHGSFTFDYAYRREGRTSVWSGTYVISGGTGSFEEATGDGIIIVIGGPRTGPVFLNGTLSR